MAHKTTGKNKKAPDRKRISGVNIVWILKNIVFMMLVLGLVKYAFSKQPSYRWMYHEMLRSNMEFIYQHPRLRFEEKMLIKLGADYEYLLFLKQSTPENAVILYPSGKAFHKKGSPFTHDIENKIYSTRFLYPRKIVLESEMKSSKYAGKITHVAIVNGEGPANISYPADINIQNGVLRVTFQKK